MSRWLLPALCSNRAGGRYTDTAAYSLIFIFRFMFKSRGVQYNSAVGHLLPLIVRPVFKSGGREIYRYCRVSVDIYAPFYVQIARHAMYQCCCALVSGYCLRLSSSPSASIPHQNSQNRAHTKSKAIQLMPLCLSSSPSASVPHTFVPGPPAHILPPPLIVCHAVLW